MGKTTITSDATKPGTINISGDGKGKVHGSEPGMKPATSSSPPQVIYDNVKIPSKSKT